MKEVLDFKVAIISIWLLIFMSGLAVGVGAFNFKIAGFDFIFFVGVFVMFASIQKYLHFVEAYLRAIKYLGGNLSDYEKKNK